MNIDNDGFMYAATCLYFLCYAPSVYADFKNKNANIYNLPEKLLSLSATTLGLIYSIRIHNIPLMVNYGPHLIMETTTLLYKIQYIYQNWSEGCKPPTSNSLCDDVSTTFTTSSLQTSASGSKPTKDVVNPIHVNNNNKLTFSVEDVNIL